jgi:hypothetical protein
MDCLIEDYMKQKLTNEEDTFINLLAEIVVNQTLKDSDNFKKPKMETQAIIKEITDYFNNNVLFIPHLSSGHLVVEQPAKELKLDIVNDFPQRTDDIKVFPILNVDQAYDVLHGITESKNREMCKGLIDKFIIKQNINLKKDLYLIAYLVAEK